MAAILIVVTAGQSDAGIEFSVQFEDNGEFDPYRDLLEANVLAAGAWWDDVLVGQGEIEVLVRATSSIPRATGRSLGSAFFKDEGGFRILEAGMAFEVRTGIDINGATPDMEINLNPSYVADTYWFDPDGSARTAPVPASRIDAMSVLIHELGHGLGFNGWMNNTNGTFPGAFKSRFDDWKVFDGENFFFTGPEATDLYGGPVPLTFGNANHLGNSAPRPGSDLLGDLMNGVFFSRGTRYEISPLNLAIVRDLGLETLAITPPSRGSVLGDRFDLNLQAFYYQADVGWQSGNTIGEGGVVSGLTFGETGSFSLLGNELLIDSEVVGLDETSEQWVVTLRAADGGEIYDPADPTAWRAMHLRDLGFGGFAGADAGLDSDNLTGLADGPLAQRIELYSEGDLIDTFDLDANATGGELQANQSFPNPGLIVFDDGVFDLGDLDVTEIRLIAEVNVVASVLAGNYDGDGLVDESDYTVWSSSFGSVTNPGSRADGNGDGVVNAADYSVWRDRAGAEATASSAVPEPSCVGHLIAVWCLADARARRDRTKCNHA